MILLLNDVEYACMFYSEIFLGNTFSSFISVINQYACDIRDVGLTVKKAAFLASLERASIKYWHLLI